MDGVNSAGPPQKLINLYIGSAVVGAILMVVGLVGGAVLKDISVVPTVAMILPGIGLLLVGIWGYGRESQGE
jgi:lipopolysaccharide export LptBFGC system permease protein LptF